MALKITAYLSKKETKRQAVMSFVKGLQQHGHKVNLRSEKNPEPAELAIVFSHLKDRHHRIDYMTHSVGGRVLVISAGILINQGYTCGWDDINGCADFLNQHSPADRWEKMGRQIKPWRKEGEVLLIAGQVPTDSSVENIDIRQWYHDIIKILRYQKKEQAIAFRPHPLSKESPYLPGIEQRGSSLFENALFNVKAVVSWNSSSAALSILEGVPVYTLDKHSIAWTISEHNLLNEPIRPQREQWAYDLAYSQWSESEIRMGECWAHLKAGLP